MARIFYLRSDLARELGLSAEGASLLAERLVPDAVTPTGRPLFSSTTVEMLRRGIGNGEAPRRDKGVK